MSDSSCNPHFLNKSYIKCQLSGYYRSTFSHCPACLRTVYITWVCGAGKKDSVAVFYRWLTSREEAVPFSFIPISYLLSPFCSHEGASIVEDISEESVDHTLESKYLCYSEWMGHSSKCSGLCQGAFNWRKHLGQVAFVGCRVGKGTFFSIWSKHRGLAAASWLGKYLRPRICTTLVGQELLQYCSFQCLRNMSA